MNFLSITAALVSICCSTPSSASCGPDEQIFAMASVIYYEARGDGLDAQQMVAEVVLNRVEHSKFPNTICDVIYQCNSKNVCQFSWVSDEELQNRPKEPEVWEESFILAEDVINGDVDYFDNGATHFLNPDAVKRMPDWTKKLQEVGRIGSHVFYEDEE